jgi:hypothetical protein
VLADGKMSACLIGPPLCPMPRGEKKGKSKFFHDARKAGATTSHFYSRQKLAAAPRVCPLIQAPPKHLSSSVSSSPFSCEHVTSSMRRASCILFLSSTRIQAVEFLLRLGLLVLVCDQDHRSLLHFQEAYIDLSYY